MVNHHFHVMYGCVLPNMNGAKILLTESCFLKKKLSWSVYFPGIMEPFTHFLLIFFTIFMPWCVLMYSSLAPMRYFIIQELTSDCWLV